MAAINGTALLVYSDGQVIAMQKGVSITVEQDLPDATNKESAGWANHINGVLNAKIDFNSLFDTSVTGGMDATALMAYITSRTSLLISILGLSFPIVAEVDINSLSFDAPAEGTMTLSGSMKVKGQLYVLTGTMANLVTDPDGTSETYDSFDITGTAITNAQKVAAAAALALSNEFSVTINDTLKCVTFLTPTSGESPSVNIYDNTSDDISNVVELDEGLNIVTLDVTATDGTAVLKISNTTAANWSMSPIYLFKV